MNRWIAATAVLLAVGLMAITPGAIAQTGRNSLNPNPNPTAPNLGTTIPNAPVGHRQPRRDEVPDLSLKKNPNDPVSREDAELDRKLKGICRGC